MLKCGRPKYLEFEVVHRGQASHLMTIARVTSTYDSYNYGDTIVERFHKPTIALTHGNPQGPTIGSDLSDLFHSD